MKIKISQLILKTFIILFLITKYSCFFNRFNSLIREINELTDFFEEDYPTRFDSHQNDKLNNKINRELKEKDTWSENLELYKMFFNFFIKNDIYDIKKKNYSDPNTRAKLFKQNKSESFFEKILITDIMFIYALMEIFLSLSLSFILIPLIFFSRKWFRSCCKKKIKEKVIEDEKEIEKILNNNEGNTNYNEEEVCSICLEEFNKFNNDIENDYKTLGHLNCKHNFHKDCIKEWIKIDKDTCPFCRKIIHSIVYIKKCILKK